MTPIVQESLLIKEEDELDKLKGAAKFAVWL